MPEAKLETGDLKESLESILEAHDEEVAPHWLRPLSFTTAIIAVLAAVASLMSGSYSNEAILEKNDAQLFQAKASDQWAFYQAKGIKGALAASQAEAVGASNVRDFREGRAPLSTGVGTGAILLGAKFQKEAERYKVEQEEIQKQAHELEAKVQEHNELSEHLLHRHHQFAYAVTLFQIAIALCAIAALARRQLLWWIGMAASLVAVGFSVRGLLL